jgi:hypothetical protein
MIQRNIWASQFKSRLHSPLHNTKRQTRNGRSSAKNAYRMKEWYRKPLTKCSVIAFSAYEYDPSSEAFTSLKFIVVSVKNKKES